MTQETYICRGNGCPVIKKIDEDTYEVIDAEGRVIKVSKAQLKLMSDAANVADTEPQLLLG